MGLLSIGPIIRIFRQNRHVYFQKRLYQNDIKRYLSEPFPQVYSQKECEQFWSQIWERSGLFQRTYQNIVSDDSFRLLLPPPNITGNLHMGHSLTVSIEDALCRFHRMNGKDVIWYGGTDHAGIATQMVIEKLLWAKHHKTRHDVSQEEFSQLFNVWKEEKVANIRRQLQAMGTSIDFNHDYFTMSDQMSNYVNDAFIELFNRNLIYRSSYMINWSYYLQSTLSDIEIEHKFISKPTDYEVPGCDEKFVLGVLHRFKYPIEEPDSSEFVTIATTRLESLMGDVALCVHPSDTRYSHMIGRHAYNPFTKRKMPIIADEVVKPEFGTGVLKLTPAHSMIDYEIACRHQLPLISIFDDRGFIQCEYEPFNNVHRYVAKRMVRDELDRRGLYCGYDPHSHWLPICARSGDIIESRIVPQWFLRCDDARYIAELIVNQDNLSHSTNERWQQLKETLDEQSRNMALIPSSYRNTWKDWFSRFKDWCISRQIFWGHRIPAYQVICNSNPTDIWVAAKTEQEALKIAVEKHKFSLNEISMKQDTDVLDTWFSSCLLPLAVSGWFEGEPNKRHVNQTLPLSLMETGHDIIFFWVARMVLLSLLLSGRIPFDRTLLHGMICDSNGKKMSKSKGNVVDPMHLIDGATLDQLVQQNKDYFDSGFISDEECTELFRKTIKNWPKGLPVCGADAVRLSLLQSDFKEQKVNFDLNKTVKKRVFTNKMHQTVRFILIHVAEVQQQHGSFQRVKLEHENLSLIDRWILTKLANLCNQCHRSFDSYDLHKSAQLLERFWINDLCDVYLESIKFDIIEKRDNAEKLLSLMIEIVEKTLQLMHPFMPFITENLFQHLQFATSSSFEDYNYQSILKSEYPSSDDSLLKQYDHSYMNEFEKIFSINRKIRSFRQQFYINREPLIKMVRVASLNSNLSSYRSIIQSTIKHNECDLEFVNLYDIYKFDSSYCIKVDFNNDELSEPDTSKTKQNNSLESDEIYLLFDVDSDQLIQRLNDPKINLNAEKIDTLKSQLDKLHMKHFNENYKKITKIIS